MEFQTSSLKAGKDIEFQDVYYNVTERKNFIKVTGTLEILKGVSGCFRNGELSAIMGPSGAGKSSLLNAISGYRTSGVSGHFKIHRADSCYITQEDHHQTLLSVEELMNLACDLKLKNCQKKAEVITEVLENLNMNHRRNITAAKLSGGERKRLSIALELVANPKIFFLDEPTSGLDEVTAAQCIRLLSHLAKQGRTIVCTIHQPSATVFNYFDRIYVMARGECVYQGKPEAVIPFLRHVDLHCPVHYSPSDYIIELCDSDEAKLIPILSDLMENGKLIYRPNVKAVEDVNAQGSITQEPVKDFHQVLTTLFMEQPRNHYFTNFLGYSTDGSLIGGATAIYEHMKAFSKRMASGHTDVSQFRQFYVLLRVMTLRIMRARTALIIQLFHHLSCGLFFGLIFYKLGNQGSRMFDHLKFCIGAVLMIVYTQVMVPILSYPDEVKIVKKQTFNRWYTLTPYYMALTISRIPLQNGSIVGPLILGPFLGTAIYGLDFGRRIPFFWHIIMKFSYIRISWVAFIMALFGNNRKKLDCDVIYCHFDDPRVLLKHLKFEEVSMMELFLQSILFTIVFRVIGFMSLNMIFNFIFLSLTYWLSGLPAEWWRFGLFVLLGQITSLISEGLGLAISATFSITIALNMLFLSMVYWMTGLPAQWWRFGIFVLVGQMTSLIAEGMGLAIGATFSITNGCAVGPLFIAPFMGLAIYGFDFAAEIPKVMCILMRFSYLRVSVESFVIAVFGFSRPKMDCDQIYCHFDDPRVLLKFLDIDQLTMVNQFILMGLLLIFFRVLLFISLKIRCTT